MSPATTKTLRDAARKAVKCITTPALRLLLRDKKQTLFVKGYVYAELLRRKHRHQQ
jgi:hypothetical protein